MAGFDSQEEVLFFFHNLSVFTKVSRRWGLSPLRQGVGEGEGEGEEGEGVGN